MQCEGPRNYRYVTLCSVFARKRIYSLIWKFGKTRFCSIIYFPSAMVTVRYEVEVWLLRRVMKRMPLGEVFFIQLLLISFTCVVRSANLLLLSLRFRFTGYGDSRTLDPTVRDCTTNNVQWQMGY